MALGHLVAVQILMPWPVLLLREALVDDVIAEFMVDDVIADHPPVSGIAPSNRIQMLVACSQAVLYVKINIQPRIRVLCSLGKRS
jgi:hypothetical protein